LKKLGCDDCQGYHTFRPLPAAAVGKLLGLQHQAFPTDRPRLAIAK
jgi:EAL domain-containing protein (putative c-di-GMP-specific phosphodiesterase class I)